ncbi:MAG TPA: TlpA disulfide reductase family protein [Pyrinomonadaceae bacterium]|nr:TlpA disulfide reductase family protein [Pyrinomonadaceae bacterium]
MKKSEKKRSFWTKGRVVLSAAVFVLSALAASSCKSDDTANLSANNRAPQANAGQPKVSITSQRGAQPQAQPQMETVPAQVWDADIQSVEGKTFRLSDFKDKVVVLDLWATWCGPCRLEVPHLVEMRNEYADKNVEVIGLTTESPQTDADKVREFAKEFNINYRLGYARADVAQSLMNGVYSIPQTFVIAPGGRIVTKFRGFSDRIPDMIRAAVEKAHAEKTGD